MNMELVKNLSLELTSYATEYSQPFSLTGFNTVQLEAVTQRLTATNLTITLEESNDNENWRAVSGATETTTAEGYTLGTKRAGLAAAHYRLKFVITGSAGQICLVSCNVNLTQTN